MEAFAVVAVVVGLAAALGATLRRNRRGVARPVAEPGPDPSVRERDEIDAIFAAALDDFDGARSALIAARLRTVVLRRVPVKSVGPAPVPRTARVIFADGTVVIARGYRAGDLGQLSVSVLTESPVCLLSYQREQDATRLEFVLSQDRRFAAQAVGVDQSD